MSTEPNTNDDTFTDARKYSYEYLKQLATFSISLIALYGAITRFMNPDGEFSDYFYIGIVALFVTVIYAVIGIIFLIYEIGSKNFRIGTINTVLMLSTTGFLVGLGFLLLDFQGGTTTLVEIVGFIILVCSIFLITLFYFLTGLNTLIYKLIGKILSFLKKNDNQGEN